VEGKKDIGDFTPSGMLASAASMPAGLEAAAVALRALGAADRGRPGTWGGSLVQAFDEDLYELVRRTSPGSKRGRPAADRIPANGAYWPRWLAAVRNASQAVSDAYEALLRDADASSAADFRFRVARRLAESTKWSLVDRCEPEPNYWMRFKSLLVLEGEEPLERFAGDVDGIGKEFVRALAYHSAALDQLPLLQALMVCRLAQIALPFLLVTRKWTEGARYFVALVGTAEPRRVFGRPTEVSRGWYFSPRASIELLNTLELQVAGGRSPAALADCDPELLREAIRHLQDLWSPTPPRRRFKRHQIDGQLIVVSGFEEILEVLTGRSMARNQEWRVRDLSKAGLGVLLRMARDCVIPDNGRLLCFRFVDGPNWQLGMVRRVRYMRAGAEVGIDTLSLTPVAAKVETGSSVCEVLLCDEPRKGETIRVVAPAHFLRADMPITLSHDGSFRELKPIDFSARSDGFDLRVYQVL
jgi:hypothetical protein